MKTRTEISTVIFILFFSYTMSVSINSNIKINNVERVMDISTQIIGVNNLIGVVNFGKSTVNEFIFAVESEFSDHVSSISAVAAGNKLTVSEDIYENHTVWVIKFENPLAPNALININLQYELTQLLVPYPTHISQNEKQLVKYIGNCYFYSFYEVVKMSTVIETQTTSIEGYVKVEPTSSMDTRIYYGPYERVPPLSKTLINIHYLNNSPFLVTTKLKRSIEISHWGNIAVEDEVTLVNKGAKLKGSFSRFEYQKEMTGSPTVHSFRTVLPRVATDIYYRDEIGNISTSLLVYSADTIEIELRPRFPLFGGWSTQYKLGYNLPTSYYLLSSGNHYVLKMPVVDLLYRNMVIEEAIINIILPEGSRNIQLTCPFNVIKMNRSLHFTYLDIIGRPVISFRKHNLGDYHQTQNFELSYVFPKIHMLREPLIIIISLFLFFILVIIYVRLDFSLSRDEISEQKLRISGICNKMLSYQNHRSNVYRSIEEKLSAFKHNKDVNNLNASIRILNNDHKYYSNQISDLAIRLKPESPEIADRISELQKLDKQLKDIYSQQQILYTEKLIPGKIVKSAFAEMENNVNAKKEDCIEKMNKLIKLIE